MSAVLMMVELEPAKDVVFQAFGRSYLERWIVKSLESRLGSSGGHGDTVGLSNSNVLKIKFTI